MGWAGLLPGFAMDLPSQRNVSMLSLISQGSAYSYRHLSLKTLSSLQLISVTLEESNNSLAHFRALQGIKDVPRSLKRGIITPVLLIG